MNKQTIDNQSNYIQEDEIDLRELFNTIKKSIFKISIFTFVVTSITIIYTLSKPNIYKSEIILVSQGDGGGGLSSKLGGLGGLAAMAGVNLGGGGGGLSIEDHMSLIIKDYKFNSYMIDKYNLLKKLKSKKSDMVFAMGSDAVYSLFNSNSDDTKEKDIKEQKHDFVKTITDIISIENDKKSGAITISAIHENRVLAKELVDIYLLEMSEYIRVADMKNIKAQLEYYENELYNAQDVALKEQLGSLISGLIQKKVLAKASKYYLLKPITDSTVAYFKDKVKPKRALIVIVSFVTSIILAIFGVFFLEFIRSNKDDLNTTLPMN